MTESVNFKLNEQRTEVVIAIEDTKLAYSAEQLEDVIRELAKIRAQMVPEVPQGINQNHLYHIESFRLIHQPESEGKAPLDVGAFLLGLSPGLGWFQLFLSADSCNNIYDWLSRAYNQNLASGPVH
jgi:hypothetical protein